MLDLATNIDDVGKQIAADMKVLGEEFVPKATETARFRASRSGLSKWVSASAKRANVPTKLIRKRSKNSRNRKGARVLRIGTMPVAAGQLKPKAAKKGYRLQGGRHYPKAFRVKGGKGGSFVTQRTGKSRKPIKAITVPVENHIKGAAKVGTDRIGEQFPKEMNSALGVQIRRQARKRERQQARSAQKLLARIR